MDILDFVRKQAEQQPQEQQQVHQEFDQASQQAPQQSLAHGVAAALRSEHTPSFGETVAHLFGNSSGEQRAGFLNHLFQVTPGGLASGLLSRFGGKKQLTAEEAQKVQPEEVQKIAAEAEKRDPSIVDHVSEFYAQHPDLTKLLGVGALAVILHTIRGRGGAAR